MMTTHYFNKSSAAPYLSTARGLSSAASAVSRRAVVSAQRYHGNYAQPSTWSSLRSAIESSGESKAEYSFSLANLIRKCFPLLTKCARHVLPVTADYGGQLLKAGSFRLFQSVIRRENILRSKRVVPLSNFSKVFKDAFAVSKPPFCLPRHLQPRVFGHSEGFLGSLNPAESNLQIWQTSDCASETGTSCSSEGGLDFYFPTIQIYTTSPIPNFKVYVPVKSRAILEIEDSDFQDTANESSEASAICHSLASLWNADLVASIQRRNEAYGDHRVKLDFLESMGGLLEKEEIRSGTDVVGWFYNFGSLDTELDLKYIREVLGRETNEVQREEEAVERGTDGHFSIFINTN